MCGIAGLITSEPLPLDARLRAMSDSIARRGPDGEGMLLHDGDAVVAADQPAVVGLAHRRLSILDLSEAAAQPMSDASGQYHLVFNGEIYNYVELREQLQREGHHFTSTGDTEVLLRALMAWGVDTLPRLVGMFAFALLDVRKRTVLVARDPFGIKPLYHARWAHGWAFASEMKALLGLPGVSREASPVAVHDYLFKGLSDHLEQTMLAGVHQLPPGCWATLSADTAQLSEPVRYWHVDLNQTLDISLDEAAERLRVMLLDAVRLHLRSDVPVAAALSGGIDSSAIVMSMRELGGCAADIHTFSFIAPGTPIDEERWVDLVVRAAGTASHKVQATADEMVRDLDGLIRVQDEPFGSTSIYAQHRVFQRVQEEGIKVSLDGQGADELFAGYRIYLPARLASAVRQGDLSGAWRLYCSACRSPDVSAATLALHGLYYSLPAQGRRLALKLLQPPWISRRWFVDRLPGEGESEPWPPRVRSLREMLYLDLTQYRIPHLLRYDDRNSMAHSVESRVPFLTPAMAQFVYSLPDRYLLDDTGLTKPVLRRALRGLVPDAVLDRRDKIGFATPEKQWLATLAPWVERVLSGQGAQRVAALDLAAARRHWKMVLSGRRRYDARVWRMINLIRWAELYDVTFDRGSAP